MRRRRSPACAQLEAIGCLLGDDAFIDALAPECGRALYWSKAL